MPSWGLGPGEGLSWQSLSGKWHSGMEISLSPGPGCLGSISDSAPCSLGLGFPPVKGIWLEGEQSMVFKTQAGISRTVLKHHTSLP